MSHLSFRLNRPGFTLANDVFIARIDTGDSPLDPVTLGLETITARHPVQVSKVLIRQVR